MKMAASASFWKKLEGAAAREAAHRRVATLRGEIPGESRCGEWLVQCDCIRKAFEAADWTKCLKASTTLLGHIRIEPNEKACKDEDCTSCGAPASDPSTWKFVPRSALPSSQSEKTEQEIKKLAAQVRAYGLKSRREAALTLSREQCRAGRPGLAAMTLAEILIDASDEPEEIEVWTARAHIFDKVKGDELGAGLLVEMHLEKAATLDSTDEEAKEAFESVKNRNNKKAAQSTVPTSRGVDPALSSDMEFLKAAAALCDQAEAYMRERFFASAYGKYANAIAHLDRIPSPPTEKLKKAILHAHLNAAACIALSGNQDEHIIEKHTAACLSLDPMCLPAYLRRADSRQRRGLLDAARTDINAVIEYSHDQTSIERAKARLQHLDFLQDTGIAGLLPKEQIAQQAS